MDPGLIPCENLEKNQIQISYLSLVCGHIWNNKEDETIVLKPIDVSKYTEEKTVNSDLDDEDNIDNI